MASVVALSLATLGLVRAGPIHRLDVDPSPSQRAHGSSGFLHISAGGKHKRSSMTGENVQIWREYDISRPIFYVNVETGEQQWTRPSGVLDALPKNAAALMQSATDPETFVHHDLIESSKVFETRPYHQMEHNTVHSDITLTFQGDVRRLPQLQRIAHTWSGPISASLLVLEADIQQVDEMINTSKSIQEHVDINLCVAPKEWYYYPVNKMRNHAIQHARTEYIFIMDGDEDPVQNMWAFLQVLKQAIVSTHADPSKTAFVVTSWMWGNMTWPDWDYPRSKEDLSRLAKAGKAVCKAADFPQAYAPLGVGLEEWMGKHMATEVPWHDRYEPYMVVHKDTIGTFDERFVGWAGNKAIHILKMQLAKVKFVLLPDVFTFTNESIPESQNRDDRPPVADPDLPERAALELGLDMGCSSCHYKECVMNCLGGLDVKDHLERFGY